MAFGYQGCLELWLRETRKVLLEGRKGEQGGEAFAGKRCAWPDGLRAAVLGHGF